MSTHSAARDLLTHGLSGASSVPRWPLFPCEPTGCFVLVLLKRALDGQDEGLPTSLFASAGCPRTALLEKAFPGRYDLGSFVVENGPPALFFCGPPLPPAVFLYIPAEANPCRTVFVRPPFSGVFSARLLSVIFLYAYSSVSEPRGVSRGHGVRRHCPTTDRATSQSPCRVLPSLGEVAARSLRRFPEQLEPLRSFCYFPLILASLGRTTRAPSPSLPVFSTPCLDRLEYLCLSLTL